MEHGESDLMGNQNEKNRFSPDFETSVQLQVRMCYL